MDNKNYNYAPLALAAKLAQDAALTHTADTKQHLLEAADTLQFMVNLLKECKQYIEDVHEYKAPPAFIKVINEVLKH